MDLPPEKTCTACGVRAPRSEYYRDAAATDGRQARCKACHKEAVRAYRARLKAINDEREAPLVDLKRCSSCGQEKPQREFHRNRSTLDGLHWVCKPCNRPSKAARQRVEQARRFRAYDVSPEEIAALLDLQGGACAICRSDFIDADFHVDHCHETGEVRGLLCRACNTALGLLRDDVGRLATAIRYLCLPPMRQIRTATERSGGRYRT